MCAHVVKLFLQNLQTLLFAKKLDLQKRSAIRYAHVKCSLASVAVAQACPNDCINSHGVKTSWTGSTNQQTGLESRNLFMRYNIHTSSQNKCMWYLLM